jgi:hypothetical protein
VKIVANGNPLKSEGYTTDLHFLFQQTGERVDAGDGVLIAHNTLAVEFVCHDFFVVESERGKWCDRESSFAAEASVKI